MALVLLTLWWALCWRRLCIDRRQLNMTKDIFIILFAFFFLDLLEDKILDLNLLRQDLLLFVFLYELHYLLIMSYLLGKQTVFIFNSQVDLFQE
jgi:hypothetical protein